MMTIGRGISLLKGKYNDCLSLFLAVTNYLSLFFTVTKNFVTPQNVTDKNGDKWALSPFLAVTNRPFWCSVRLFGFQQWHSFAELFRGWDLSIDPSISEVIIFDHSDL